MRYRPFGKTGLYVSELCLGAMTFGHGEGIWQAIGALDASAAQTLIGSAFDAGVNLIDTADVYSAGQSESLVGTALAALGRPRDEYLIATKVRGRFGPGANQVGLSRGHILDSIDASLRRLRLDHVDLYQIHGLDPETPIEETLEALDHVVRAGKARYVGFCNLAAWHAMKAIAYSRERGLARFVSAQVYYSIAGRDIEREIVPLAADQGLAILPWSPLAGGLLSGKFDLEQAAPPASPAAALGGAGAPGAAPAPAAPSTAPASAPAGARRSSFDFPPVDRERGRVVVAAMREVAAAAGVSVARVALAWILTRPFVTSIILGAKNPEQLADNLAASELELTAEQVAKLDAASDLPAEYPGWMLDWQARGRTPANLR